MTELSFRYQLIICLFPLRFGCPFLVGLGRIRSVRNAINQRAFSALPTPVGRRADWTPIGALTSCFLLTQRGQYRALNNRLTVEQLRNRLSAGRVEAPTPESQTQEPKLRREPAPKRAEEGFAHILDDPEKLRELRENAEKRDRKLGRHQRRSRGLSV